MIYQHDRQLAFGKSGSAALLFITVARMDERRNDRRRFLFQLTGLMEQAKEIMDKVDDVTILLPILVDN